MPGGRINPTAGVAGVGQCHSGGICMVDGATGQHLGEWKKGEAYMILSRDTYADNKHLVDELLDTSLYQCGAPVHLESGYYEDGSIFGSSSSAPAATGTGRWPGVGTGGVSGRGSGEGLVFASVHQPGMTMIRPMWRNV